MAKHSAVALPGPINNTQDVPGDAKGGTEVDLIVASCNGKQIAFRWPTAADAPKEEKDRQKPKGGSNPKGGKHK